MMASMRRIGFDSVAASRLRAGSIRRRRALTLSRLAFYIPPAASARAPMAELVDASDSKSDSARSAGSIPARGTSLKLQAILTLTSHRSSIGWRQNLGLCRHRRAAEKWSPCRGFDRPDPRRSPGRIGTNTPGPFELLIKPHLNIVLDRNSRSSVRQLG